MSPFFIALAITDVLLLWLLVQLPVRTHWFSKIAAIVIVLALNFLAWSAAGSGRGWPVSEGFPAKGQFVACQVVEPNISQHERGSIYVWIVPLDFKHGVLSYRPNSEEPRAYREPYNRSLHVACAQAKKASGQGITVGIRKREGHRHGGQSTAYHAYQLPSPQLPRKVRGS